MKFLSTTTKSLPTDQSTKSTILLTPSTPSTSSSSIKTTLSNHDQKILNLEDILKRFDVNEALLKLVRQDLFVTADDQVRIKA